MAVNSNITHKLSALDAFTEAYNNPNREELKKYFNIILETNNSEYLAMWALDIKYNIPLCMEKIVNAAYVGDCSGAARWLMDVNDPKNTYNDGITKAIINSSDDNIKIYTLLYCHYLKSSGDINSMNHAYIDSYIIPLKTKIVKLGQMDEFLNIMRVYLDNLDMSEKELLENFYYGLEAEYKLGIVL